MDINKKIHQIKLKQVFETGNEKQFIRVKDIVWLIATLERQQKEINRLEKRLDNAKCMNDNF